MLLMLMVIIGIIANPNTVPQKSAALNGCPSICISAATRSTTFSTVSWPRHWNDGDAKSSLTLICTALFIIAVFVISRGTLHELRWRGNFADTWYLYCGPMVFICAVSLFTVVKNKLNARTLPGLGLISRHSLGIYGFHALIIHALRTNGLELKRWPPLDIVWVLPRR